MNINNNPYFKVKDCEYLFQIQKQGKKYDIINLTLNKLEKSNLSRESLDKILKNYEIAERKVCEEG